MVAERCGPSVVRPERIIPGTAPAVVPVVGTVPGVDARTVVVRRVPGVIVPVIVVIVPVIEPVPVILIIIYKIIIVLRLR